MFLKKNGIDFNNVYSSHKKVHSVKSYFSDEEANDGKKSDSDSEPEKKEEKPRSLFDEHARIRLEKQRKEMLADQIRKQQEEERRILEAVREERALLRYVQSSCFRADKFL